uniref:Putative fatty acid-binding protein, heart-like protein n=1 Tax=Pinctada fucata TaxID=50426 RepID=A0A194ALM0_PINFU
MANFNGKWEIMESDSDNFDEYMKSVGVEEDKRKDAHAYLGDKSKMTYEICITGNDGCFKVDTPKGQKEIKFKMNEEFDTLTLDMRPIKAIFSMDGDKLMEVQEGPGFKTTNTRTVDGDVLTLTMTSNSGVSCTRKYKRV